ncbi:Hypothetical predicted protein [Cloeon dipterum]|uniref:Mediator of RNA polymerase II transcription subunit 14 n=1 Tax=Cloeon dipterum TaxID=197152 RepID=A0A8S1D8T4_9INSE|nr:Hypothetical predicted protein [Cloeon dipterum]
MQFLDKQSLLLVETADLLTRVARDTLVHARLPSFHIPAAVEVLTTGTYARLPAVVRERIVPPDPISAAERRQTLLRLNQVIQHRLVTSDIRPQMRNLKIEAGRVTFVVDREFEVCLTVMGEGENVPWRLLSVKILVADKETGEGRPLVHPLQTHYLHEVLQSRLVDEKQPLHEVYDLLHHFCLSLRLEVLYCQTVRLCRERLEEHVRIEEYRPGRTLSVSYWRHLADQPQHRLTLHADPHDAAKPLAVAHLPSLAQADAHLVEQALANEQLSVERLLVHTIYLRARARLQELNTELLALCQDLDCELQGSPAVLSVAVLQPCLRAELMLVSVDTHSGQLLVHVPQWASSSPAVVTEVQMALNHDRTRLPTLLPEVRFWLAQRRCEKTLQHLPASAHERLPLLHAADHPLTRLSRHRMYVRLHRHRRVILLVELLPAAGCRIRTAFHLLMVKPASIEDSPDDDAVETEFPKTYLRVQHMVELDMYVATHGPCTAVDESCGQKRKAAEGPAAKRAKHSEYFIPELSHVVAMCDERLPLVTVAAELSKRGIPHQGIQVEAGATAVVLRIVKLPTRSPAFEKRLLSVSLRMQGKGGRAWLAEFVFHGAPLQSTHPREQTFRRPVYFQYELGLEEHVPATVDALLRDWHTLENLYQLVDDLAFFFKNGDKYGLSGLVTIKSYSYKRLVVSYGAERALSVSVTWSAEERAFKLILNPSTSNPHSLVREQLQAHLNRHRDLALTLALVCETQEPLQALAKLPGLPQLGVFQSKLQVATQGFTLLPQSPTHLRLVYQGVYCLEVRVRGQGLVSIRDGSYSHLDRTHILSDLTPTQGLKAFLSKYVDESAVFMRRRSQSEDDNPPSPVVAMENPASNPGSASGQSETQNTSSPSVPSPFLGGLRPQSPPRGPDAPCRRDAFPSPAAHAAQQPSHPGQPPPRHGSRLFAGVLLLGVATTGGRSDGATGQPFADGAAISVAHLALAQSAAVAAAGPELASAGRRTLSCRCFSSGDLGRVEPVPVLSGGVQLARQPERAPRVPGGCSGSAGPQSGLHAEPGRGGRRGGCLEGGAAHVAGAAAAVVGRRRAHAAHLRGPRPAVHPGAGSRPRQPPPAPVPPRALPRIALPAKTAPEAHPVGRSGNYSFFSPPLFYFSVPFCLFRQTMQFSSTRTNLQLHPVANQEPGVVHLRTDTMMCRVYQNTTHLQSLHVKLSPLDEHDESSWSAEEFQLLEKFFETKVACPPFKPQALVSFARMLIAPYNVLKDVVQIIRFEMVPQIGLQQNWRWSVQWRLRNPPSNFGLIPIGVASFVICRQKVLFFLSITRQGVQYPPGVEPPSFILPLVYDIVSNITQLALKQELNQVITSVVAAAHMQMKRFSETHAGYEQCSLLPAIRDLLANMVMPNEPQPLMPPMAASQVCRNRSSRGPLASNGGVLFAGGGLAGDAVPDGPDAPLAAAPGAALPPAAGLAHDQPAPHDAAVSHKSHSTQSCCTLLRL